MAPHSPDLNTRMVTLITSTITTITMQVLRPLLCLSLSPAVPWRGPVPCPYPAEGSAPAPSTMTSRPSQWISVAVLSVAVALAVAVSAAPPPLIRAVQAIPLGLLLTFPRPLQVQASQAWWILSARPWWPNRSPSLSFHPAGTTCIPPMVLWRALYTTSPPHRVLTLTVTPLPLHSLLLKATTSFPTPCSPTTPRYPLMARATLCLLPLLPLFHPTTSQALLPPCHSTWPPSTRHCSTTCPCWAPMPCRGSTSTTFCRGWRFRGGE